MQTNEVNNPFIFFLSLEDSLPASFYKFDGLFKEQGFILVPVRVDQLQSLVSSTDQEQIIVISSVTNFREYKLYNEKVRGLLKFILKSKRLTFMNLSSFSKPNDSRNYSLQKNYFFMRYPIDAMDLTEKISRYHELKISQNSRWPGGKRANHSCGVA